MRLTHILHLSIRSSPVADVIRTCLTRTSSLNVTVIRNPDDSSMLETECSASVACLVSCGRRTSEVREDVEAALPSAARFVP